MTRRTRYGAPMILVLIASLTVSTSRATVTRRAPPAASTRRTSLTRSPNAYFPLEPGWAATLPRHEDGERFVERVVVTDRTKVVPGVTTIVIRDVIRHKGRPGREDRGLVRDRDDGTVWYFGEDTAEYDDDGDVISTDGSWEAGVDGAVAGIIMPADPRPTDAYRQEYLHGRRGGPGVGRGTRHLRSRCRTAASTRSSARSSGAAWSRAWWSASSTRPASASCASTRWRAATRRLELVRVRQPS